MKSKFSIVLFALALTACHVGDPVISNDYEAYRLDGVADTKKFRVTLTNVKTGQVHESIYVQKHCASKSRAVVGAIYRFPTTRYERSATEIDLSDFCNSL